MMVPAPDFGGFYFGLSIGMRNSQANWTTTSTRGGGGLVDPATANSDFGTNAVRGDTFAGFNMQRGNLVFGIEADGGYANSIDTHAGIPGGCLLIGVLPNCLNDPAGVLDPFIDPGRDRTRVRTLWDASARGRLGYTLVPSVMGYLTAGAAFQNVDVNLACTAVRAVPPAGPQPVGGAFCAANRNETFNTTPVGLAVGVGLETLLADRWTGRIEYRYADFGTLSHTFFTGTGDAVTARLSLSTHTVKVGIALKFGAPAAPLVAKY
jgi:outer membrane immunogenic protein